ncbi:MAG: hypothetical protein OXC03_09285 [Flavobacteriaceae bacterium]|nr:hypothetical protein [Flavobacteriaceae bacterium]
MDNQKDKEWVKQIEEQINRIDKVFLEYGHPYDHVDFGNLTHEDRHRWFWWDEFFRMYLDLKTKITDYNKNKVNEIDTSLNPIQYREYIDSSLKKFFYDNQDLQILKQFNKLTPYVHKRFKDTETYN